MLDDNQLALWFFSVLNKCTILAILQLRGNMLISPTCLYIACLMCVCRNVLFLCCDVIMWCAFGCCLAWSHHTCVSVLRTV